MDASTAMMIGNMATGLMKNQQEQKNQAAQSLQRAYEMRYSPWTGIKNFTEVQRAPGLGSNLMGAAAASMAQKQEMDKYNADQAMRNEWMNILKSERAGKATPQDQAFGFAPYQPTDRLGLYR